MKRLPRGYKKMQQDELTISIFYGGGFVEVLAEPFEQCINLKIHELFDVTQIGTQIDSYINAFEWLLANIYRIVGIQLYNDGEIRLNILPSRIKENRKCLFLKEDHIQNRELDFELYSFLVSIFNNSISL